MVLYGLLGGISKGAGFLLLPVLAQKFSPSELGVLDLMATITSFLSFLLTLQLESAVMRFWNDCKSEPERANLISSSIFLVLIVGVIALATMAIFSGRISQIIFNDLNHGYIIVIGSFQALLQSIVSIPSTGLRMQRRIIEFNLLQILQIILYFIIATLFIFKIKLGIEGVALALLFSYIPMLVVSLILQRKLIRLSFNKDLVFSGLKYGLPMLPAVMMTWFNAEVDKVLLLKYSTLESIGLFGVSEKLSGVIILIISIFVLAWTPLSLEAITLEASERDRFFKRILKLYSFSLFGIAGAGVLILPFVVDVLFPKSYSASLPIVPWLITAFIFKGASSITGIGVLITKKTFFNSIITVFGATINLIAGIWAIPRLGLLGAAVGTFLAYFFVMLCQSFISKRLTGINFNLTPICILAVVFIFFSHIFLKV